MFRIIALVLLVLCPLAQAIAAEAELFSEEEARDLFELWNQCRPIGFELKFDNRAKAKVLNLTRDDVHMLVRNRLQAARIYTKDYLLIPESHPAMRRR